MCTAVMMRGVHPLFGRTLDLERGYGEVVVATPRHFGWRFLREDAFAAAFAMLGTACVWEGVPLYYDAVNEFGLAMAGLHFPTYAHYRPSVDGACDLASYEVIPFVLGRCRTVSEALSLLRHTNITPESIHPSLPATPLHWMLTDGDTCMVLEPREDGLHLYDDPYGVLTNSPPLDYHVAHLSAYAALDAVPPQNHLCPNHPLAVWSRGMGAMGLPGDWSSASRFVRAVFVKNHTLLVEGGTEVDRFFHVMDTVSVPRGCILTDDGQAVQTIYTCCMDLADATYYYTTYDCRRVRAVSLRHLPSDGEKVAVFSMAGEG